MFILLGLYMEKYALPPCCFFFKPSSVEEQKKEKNPTDFTNDYSCTFKIDMETKCNLIKTG